VPVTIVKGNEFRATKSSNRLSATNTLLSEQLSKAFSAIRLFIFRREFLASQHLVAMRAYEAFAMPRCVLVRDSSLVDHSVTLETSLRVLLFIARNADYFLVTWYKTLASYWLQTSLATEALLMPLLALVLKLLHSCSEQSPTSIASCSEVVVMTISAIESIVLVGERMIN